MTTGSHLGVDPLDVRDAAAQRKVQGQGLCPQELTAEGTSPPCPHAPLP